MLFRVMLTGILWHKTILDRIKLEIYRNKGQRLTTTFSIDPKCADICMRKGPVQFPEIIILKFDFMESHPRCACKTYIYIESSQ